MQVLYHNASYQNRGAFRLDHARESRLVLLAADVRVHEKTKADPRDEEVVQDAVDAMALDQSNLAPACVFRCCFGCLRL